MSLLTLAVVLLPLAAAFAAAVTRSGSAAVARTSYLVNALGLAVSLSLLLMASFSDPVSITLVPGGDALLGLSADRLGALLLLLVFGVSTIVQVFSARYLRGDVRQRRFFVAANLLTAATAFMVASVSLIGLAIGWSFAGMSLILLLGMYPGFASADNGARRTTVAFVTGDAALWTGVILATIAWGPVNLSEISSSGLEAGAGGVTLTLVACLAVVAALSRSGQFPFHTWLPTTVAVPTPVSALLHAGVVNAGGILLVRISPIFGASPEATHLAFFAGAATMVYGTSIMLTKSDVKGALAHSTMGQMGFMIMTCGLGAWAAAIFHLFAHGMYKASLFLGSGSAVQSGVRAAMAPPVPIARPANRMLTGVVSLLVPGVTILAAGLLVYPDPSSASAALLAFAWVTAACALWGWTARQPGAGGILTGSAVIVAATFAYVFLLRVASEFLGPDLSQAGEATVAAAWILLPVCLMAAIGLVRSNTSRSMFPGLHKHLYVGVLGASQTGLVRRRRVAWAPIRDVETEGGLVPSSEGVRA